MTQDNLYTTSRDEGAAPGIRSTGDSAGAQYLTFLCNGQEYGVEILRVQEIKGCVQVASIPHSPDFVLGVMNLRGSIVPVVELRRRFGLDAASCDASTVVVVVRAGVARHYETVGILVDAVAEVYSIDGDAVRPPPEFGTPIDRAFVSGIATAADKMVMLLDIAKLVGCAVTAPAEPAA
jgi:purine-binding chemotaxis protein CheW